MYIICEKQDKLFGEFLQILFVPLVEIYDF